MTPECDVILPVHNGEKTLTAAVHSILTQTYGKFRLMVIDDGSSDRTLEMLRGFNDPRMQIVINEQNIGLPATLNRGVELARAPFIARMDADDIAHPNRLELQIEILKKRPELDLVGTAVVSIDSEGKLLGKRIYPTEHRDIIRRPYRSIPIAHPTWCGRREWFSSHPYEVDYPRSQDQVLLRTALGDSCFANLAQPLLAYRELTAIRPLRTLGVRRLLAVNILKSAIKDRRYFAGLMGATGLLSRWFVDLLVWATRTPRLATYRFQPLSYDMSKEWESIIHESSFPSPTS